MALFYNQTVSPEIFIIIILKILIYISFQFNFFKFFEQILLFPKMFLFVAVAIEAFDLET